MEILHVALQDHVHIGHDEGFLLRFEFCLFCRIFEIKQFPHQAHPKLLLQGECDVARNGAKERHKVKVILLTWPHTRCEEEEQEMPDCRSRQQFDPADGGVISC